MDDYSRGEAAERAGVGPDYVARLAELGILASNADDRFTSSDVRRTQVVQALERAGMPVDSVASLVREGRMSLEFIDAAGYHVFAALSDTTFEGLSQRTGVPVDLLMALREAVGGKQATPQDRVRDDELAIVPLLELQHRSGFRSSAMERALRVYGDSLRRIAETEAEWWRTEIQEPMLARGLTRTMSADSRVSCRRSCRLYRTRPCWRSTTPSRCTPGR